MHKREIAKKMERNSIHLAAKAKCSNASVYNSNAATYSKKKLESIWNKIYNKPLFLSFCFASTMRCTAFSNDDSPLKWIRILF